MSRLPKQKLKLLYLLRLLAENSDERHPITTPEIIERLAADDIHAERKSIYDDIEQLMDFGYDIVRLQSRLGGGCYLASRRFELAELKLLVDAVQSSRFISVRKSRELIGKLEQLASRYDAGKLQRQVYVAGRVKTRNEGIYYSIDSIHRAIQENRQIQFTYLEWTVKKELRPRRAGEKYQVSPWALIWRDENYYLAAFDSGSGVMKHYRVDKMGSVVLTDREREGMEQFSRMDLAAYTNRTFGMFGGEQEMVTLEFPDRLAGVVLDRFGRGVDLRPGAEGVFHIRVEVAVSGQFFGWLAGIGKEARIVGPEDVRTRYREWLREILNADTERTGIKNSGNTES